IAALLQRGGIGLVPQLPCGNNEAAWPIKMFEFMAAGLPLIYSDLPGHREIAGTVGAGIPVDPQRPEQIANAIEQLSSSPGLSQRLGEAGRLAVRERLNWDMERVKLLDLYREILGPCDRSGRQATPLVEPTPRRASRVSRDEGGLERRCVE
ncbi:MAG: glycosyltransferase, partial [Solirubrobacterales bacterium]|nr:glycosyltransferase [Solirubrobacterales bacterium]